MSREARTEPLPHPQPESAPPASGAPDWESIEAAALEDGRGVRFKDGRVAILTENSAYDARMKRKALLKMGISPAIDQMDFTAGMALLSIDTLGREPFKAPTTEITLNALLMDGMSEGDTYKLMRAYSALVGEGDPSDKDFR